MRELHGVMFSGHSSLGLKRRALLFDKFHIWHLNDEEFAKTKEFEVDLAFLRSQGIVVDEPFVDVHEFAETMIADTEDSKRLWAQLEHALQLDRASSQVDLVDGTLAVVRDNMNRMVTLKIPRGDGFDVVPICELSLPNALPVSKAFSSPGIHVLNDIATVTLSAMPVPDESCSWQDIIDFKAENRDKKWAFRRFLETLATKRQTEAEIRDDIEWTLNEYRNAMKIHRIKSSQSFVDVFLITPLEILEDLVKLKWAKLAKGLLSVNQRHVNLMEAEIKAPGRECAYLFDAQQRFRVK
jgi:hypothetical protein